MKRQVTIAREAGFSFGGLVVGQVLRFVFNLVVASLLGAKYLGVYALAFGIIQIVEMLAVSGLDMGVLRYVNLNDRSSDKQRDYIAGALRFSLLYSLPVTLLVIAFSGTLAALLNGDELLRSALVCYSLSIPFSVLMFVAGHSIQAYKKLRPKIIAGQIILPGAVLPLLLLVDAVAGGTAALLIAPPLAQIAAFVWIWFQLKAITGVSAKEVFEARTDREMLRYARPLMFVALMSMVSHWLDILMLGWYTDPESVGLYQPAVRTAGLMRSVLLAFAGIAAPLFADMHGRGETVELQKMFKVVSRWALMVAMPLAVVLLVMPESVLALFGGAFIVAAPVLVVLAAALLLQCFFGLYDTMLQMTGYSKICFINGLAGLAVHVVLNMMFIPYYGMIGAAWALLVLYFLLGAVRVVEVRSLLAIHAFSIPLLKPFAAGTVSGIALAAAKPFLETQPVVLSLVGALLLVIAVYLLLIRLMKLEQEELDVILELFSFVKK